MSRKTTFIIALAIILVAGGVFAYRNAFGPLRGEAAAAQFTIALPAAGTEPAPAADLAERLVGEGFVRSAWAFRVAASLEGLREVAPGAYRLSPAMSAWEVVETLARGPALKWVVIPEGKRKEEIADILAATFDWSAEVKATWIASDTAPDADHIEGVYFPDTYLIPTDETPTAVADRLRARFEEKFQPYAPEAAQQNIKWTTLLKIASLVQRESGKNDMPLIAGIIWNRLLTNMKLDIDATLQYVKGSEESGWWPAVTAADKKLDSPYNTYKNTGLPPHPIANPGLDAIAAALHPAETKCLYYLHDKDHIIHCAVTYAEHQQNVEKYLR